MPWSSCRSMRKEPFLRVSRRDCRRIESPMPGWPVRFARLSIAIARRRRLVEQPERFAGKYQLAAEASDVIAQALAVAGPLEGDRGVEGLPAAVAVGIVQRLRARRRRRGERQGD